jgi:hypothetical protein
MIFPRAKGSVVFVCYSFTCVSLSSSMSCSGSVILLVRMTPRRVNVSFCVVPVRAFYAD